MNLDGSEAPNLQWKFEQVHFRQNSSQPLGKMEYAKFHIEERELGRSNGFVSHWILSKDGSSNDSKTSTPISKRKLYSAHKKHERYTPCGQKKHGYKPASEQDVYIANAKKDASTQRDYNLYSRMFESLVGKEEALRIDEQYQQAKRKNRIRRASVSISDLCTNT
jgi:hypothetical protein